MKLHSITSAALLGVALAGYSQQAPATPLDADAESTTAKISTVPPGLPNIHPVEFKNITYRHVDDQGLQLDVYQQPGATNTSPAPVIVYWHGGAWWKGQRPASYGSFRPLIDMGFSIVSVDYRLTGVALAPAAVQDVRCSLAWVKQNAAQYHFDVNRIVAYGTSAGGHLALMAGFLPAGNSIDPADCGAMPRVAAVMDFYGIPDVKGVITSGIPLSKSTARWLGGPDKLELAAEMSPVTYLRAGLPPVFIAHGDVDPVVPYQQSVALRKSLESLKVPVTMYTVPGGVHGNYPPEQMLIIYEALQKFFTENHLIPPAQ